MNSYNATYSVLTSATTSEPLTTSVGIVVGTAPGAKAGSKDRVLYARLRLTGAIATDEDVISALRAIGDGTVAVSLPRVQTGRVSLSMRPVYTGSVLADTLAAHWGMVAPEQTATPKRGRNRVSAPAEAIPTPTNGEPVSA